VLISFPAIVNTKAEIRFHVQTADWIPEDVRQKLLELVSEWFLHKKCNANSDDTHVYACMHVLIFVSPCFVLQSKNRINKAGELLVTSEVSRSQRRNLQDCVQKIAALIAEASVRPPEPSPEDLELRALR